MASGESKTFVAANERVLILLLCVAAALRVFIFSAAFPFFSNIDEDLHFDLITQYSHRHGPRSFDRINEETLNWIRFLNVPLIALIVWLGCMAARTIAPEQIELRVGVSLLLAFIPQNVFYTINNDVLSPLCFGALFLCILQWLRTKAPSFLLGTLTGLAVAATCLTKLSNLPLVAVALAVILARSIEIILRTPRAGLIALAALISFAVIPVGTWMLWTKFHFGDLTG